MHLENNGARFAQPIDLNKFQLDDLRHGFLVVPFDCGIDLTSLPDRAGAMNLVTNLWVERCLHGKRLIDPADDILCKPFGHLSISGKLFSGIVYASVVLTYPGFSELTINSTGFVGIELLHVTKIVKLMGMHTQFLAKVSSDVSYRSCIRRAIVYENISSHLQLRTTK